MVQRLISFNLSAEDNYLRATLSFDGVLTMYYVPKNSIGDDWSMVTEALPENICMTNQNPGPDLGSGICGFNSICSLGDDQRPTCTCPEGYSLVDPNDKHGSCKPNVNLDGCEGYADRVMKEEYKLLRLSKTDWPFNDYEKLDFNNEDDCRNSCKHDCFCAATTFQDNTKTDPGCWKKKAPLSNGRKDNTVLGTLWLKVRVANNSNEPLNPILPPLNATAKGNSPTKVLFWGSISVNILLLSTIGLGTLYIYQKRTSKVVCEGRRETLREYSNVHGFSYKELKEATNGFEEELGKGSLGIAYKGMISGGGLPIFVAVKK